MAFRRVARGGEYFRVADVDWDDPLDGAYSMVRGGRWNPPGSSPVVYLCATRDVARANVARKFRGLPYTAAELAPGAGPDLVTTSIPQARFVDVVTAAGCAAVGLPSTYPLDSDGAEIPWAQCQQLGLQWWAAGENGIACRSAALVTRGGRPRSPGEELAWFQRGKLTAATTLPFEAWFWP